MKKLSLLLLTLTICFFTACHKSIWEELENLDQRVTKLEELCKEMNTNIISIQTIVNVNQSGDYITGIVEIKKDGKVIGYTITFGKHDPITIYHGQDGKDGQNGADGKDGQDGSSNTPVIGVAKDTDGVYYWTLNGEWLLDDNGNKLPVSGTNGKDGQNGTNGTMPQLKIEEGYWYVSYDNGITWTQLGKATGEDGQNGDKGDKGDTGDSMFQSVTQDENYVYFTLADGTVIKIGKGNGANDQPKENDIIDFKDLAVKGALMKLAIDTTGDGEISYGEAAAYTGDFNFHFQDNLNIYSFKELQYFTSVTNIGSAAFSGCENLLEIKLPNSIKSISYSAFQNCKSLRIIVIPENVNSIEGQAFHSCENLKYITIPKHLNNISSSAFEGTAWLKDQPDGPIYINQLLYDGYKGEMPKNTAIRIIDGIQIINEYAFSNNHNLTSVSIPSSVTTIKERAFYNCSTLVTIKCHAEKVPYLEEDVFYTTGIWGVNYCSQVTLYVPKSSVEDYMYADQWKAMGKILPIE